MTPNSHRRHFLRLSIASGVALAGARFGNLIAEEVPMWQHKIPHGGESVPMLGLGTWQQFDIDRNSKEWNPAKETLKSFLAHGLRIVDSSPMYGRSEAVIGEMLAELDPKAQAFVATKVWTRGRDEGRKQIEQSFQRLRRERIDLLQVHNLLDLDTHWPTLRALKREGRVKYLGVSHYTASAYPDLLQAFKLEELDVVQLNYSLSEREAEQKLLPAAQAAGIAVLVNRPFAEGDLFRRTRGKPLPDFAAQIGCATWAQFVLKFILSHPAVTCAIPGTNRPDHLLDNIMGCVGVVPDKELRARMAEAYLKLA
jgi:aryl-alcohol dehydrogenase-like predicted oxidoreductase